MVAILQQTLLQSIHCAVTAAMQYIKEEIKQDIKNASFSLCLLRITDLDNGPEGISVALSVLSREKKVLLQYESTDILTGCLI